MNEMLTLVVAWMAGGMLGAIFFGGLWLTVIKAAATQRAALWFPISLLLRMGIAIAGFYAVGHGHWERLIVCLLGFVMARLIVMSLTRSTKLRTSLTKGDPSCV